MNHKEIARKLAEESIVLLKNDGLLPLTAGQKISFFGRTQEDTIFSGNGSGACHADSGWSILTACEKAGLIPEPELAAFYRAQVAAGVGCQEEIDWSKAGDCVNSGLVYELFGKYRAPAEDYNLTEMQIKKARDHSDTAIVVLGRNSGGEECDRHLDEDYYLTAREIEMLRSVCHSFEKIVLILNINGVIDLAWTEYYPQIRSILFIGIPGEQGTVALADILIGKGNPSGRLAFTFAKQYEDYPSAMDFSWDKPHDEKVLTYASYGLSAEENGSRGFALSPVTVYREGIYCGYRWFDAAGIVPLYPFGHGLSYSDFSVETVSARQEGGEIQLSLRVTNTGNRPGKHTVLLWLSAETGKERPVRQLVGFGKTAVLQPGEIQLLQIGVPLEEFAEYDEATAAFVIDAGEYFLRVEEKSAVHIAADRNITIRQCKNRMGIRPCNRDKLDFAHFSPNPFDGNAPLQLTLSPWETQRKQPAPMDFRALNGVTDTELATLCVGYGPGVPFSAFLKEKLPNTAEENGTPVAEKDHPTGFLGYVSPAIPAKGIHSVFYKDGPAGIGETAWPTEMLIACCFNRELWYAFGDAVGEECEKEQVDVWLAPAVNLHRNPLGGRCFEYFSEDPFLTGCAGVAVTRGIQENHKVLVCPKHFACNEQETYRRGNGRKNIDAVDSILPEKVLREIYLKPFQMLVEQANIHSIMTSFNKINGTFSAGSRELCTNILREEWGFSGAVVTDWGDMDTVVDGADAVKAGNDIVMPGGPPVIAQIQRGLAAGTVTRSDLCTAAKHLQIMIQYTKRG